MPSKHPLNDPTGSNLELEVAALRAVLGGLPMRTATVSPVATTEPRATTSDEVDADD